VIGLNFNKSIIYEKQNKTYSKSKLN